MGSSSRTIYRFRRPSSSMMRLEAAIEAQRAHTTREPTEMACLLCHDVGGLVEIPK